MRCVAFIVFSSVSFQTVLDDELVCEYVQRDVGFVFVFTASCWVGFRVREVGAYGA